MMDVDRALSPEERILFTPRAVHVGLLGNGLRSVWWRPPASERPVASYRVWSDSVKVAEVPGTQTSEIIKLDGARTHYIQVQAVDADGNESNRTEHWVIGRPITDHLMNHGTDTDRDQRESVNAPGRRRSDPPEGPLVREHRSVPPADRTGSAGHNQEIRAEPPDIAKSIGWLGLISGVISLWFARLVFFQWWYSWVRGAT